MQEARVERKIAGRVLSISTGRMARLAAGSALARYGDTVVFAAVTSGKPREGIDFFPLTVDYREKTYAAGKFPGGFIKREGRPTTKEILTSRLIDRPIRPLFPEAYKDEVQVQILVLSADEDNDPDIVAMIAAFAALEVAPVPFQGPLGAVRIGRVEGRLVPMPTHKDVDVGDLELVVAGTPDAITMVEGGSLGISEEELLDAINQGHRVASEIAGLVRELGQKAGVVKPVFVPPVETIPPYIAEARREFEAPLRVALLTPGKQARIEACRAVEASAVARFAPPGHEEAGDRSKALHRLFEDMEYRIVRGLLLEGRRIDGRALDEIRPISVESGLLPRTHGSALFTRGETQALVTVTLGTPRDQQIVDGLKDEYAKRLDLQYNFPPFCTGETKPIRGPSRREIGHGNLAERALAPVVPPDVEFPYTVRIVSDIMESNGSSSMATVCGGTLALMDAGVPIRQPVAGVAMGLLKEGPVVRILSDILGTEDHLGDMDFKVAGTGRGITAVQMDIKVEGLTSDILRDALRQAKEGRLHVLRKMLAALPRPRKDISPWAPRMLIVRVPQEKIGLVIGPGGKTIKRLEEETGANIEIDDDGTIHISCTAKGGAEAARDQIQMLTAEVEIGQVYTGKVVSIKDFGAFVEILPGQEGLLHVSEMSDTFVSKVSDVVKIGDRIEVKVIAKDEQDRIKLSRKAVLQSARR